MAFARPIFAGLIERYFRPFETHLKPLELPVTPMPDKGPLRLVWHFARMFRRQLVIVSILAMISSLLGLLGIWAIAFVVDGVTAEGARAFLLGHMWILASFFVLFVIVSPLVFLLRQRFHHAAFSERLMFRRSSA